MSSELSLRAIIAKLNKWILLQFPNISFESLQEYLVLNQRVFVEMNRLMSFYAGIKIAQ